MSGEEQQFWRDNLSGWKGLSLRCVGDEFNYAGEICSSVAAEIEKLSAIKELSFLYTGMNIPYFDHLVKLADSGLEDSLQAEIYIRGTNGSVPAIYGRISVRTHYSDAVEKGADQDKPLFHPRSGDLIIWSRDVIGTGQSDKIVKEISDALKDHASSLFSKYLVFAAID